MNYFNKTIKIDVFGAGTLDIMEWIRDNGCPNLDHTTFVDARGNKVAVVSKGEESMFSATLEAIEIGLYSWKEFDGMKRHSGAKNFWLFLIDGNYYWATR
jgi:hypothetical protein